MNRLIKERLEESAKLYKIFIEYFDKLKPLLTNEYGQINKDIETFLTSLKTEYIHLSKKFDVLTIQMSAKNQDITDSLIEFYANYTSYYININRLINLFNASHLQSENIHNDNLSQTYKLETSDLLAILILDYTNYNKKYQHVDVILMETFSDFIFTECDKSYEFFERIRKAFKKNEYCIDLYAKIVGKIIEHMYNSKNMKDLSRITNANETDKDEFLTKNAKNKVNSYDVHIMNPYLKTFSLVPVSELMPFDAIVEKIFNVKFGGHDIPPVKGSIRRLVGGRKETVDSGYDNLDKYCKKNNLCVILLHRVIYHPVVYDIRRLSLTQSGPGSKIKPGINPSVVKDYDTIIKIDKDQNYDFSYHILGVPDVETNYVIEKVADDHYRILSPYFNSTTYSIPKHKVNDLVFYIRSKPLAPTRVSCYHKNATQKSTRNMFARNKVNLNEIETKSEDIDTQLIKNDIYYKIRSHLQDLVEKEYEHADKIRGIMQLNEIIHDQNIKNIFINTIFNNYKLGKKMYSSQTFDGGNFSFSEIMSSFLSELDATTRRFMKNLHDELNRIKIDSDVFKATDKEHNIMKLLDEIVLNSINFVISDKDNIFSVINYKYLLLNLP